MRRIIAAAALLALCLPAHAEGFYRCVNIDGSTRYTKDPYDVWVGDQCTEVSKAEATRPPTKAELKAMRTRAGEMDFWELCGELGYVIRGAEATPHAVAWKRTLMAETKIPAADIRFVHDQRLRVGMDECSVVAVLGKPDDMNRTNNASGRFDQLVYRDRGMYVYTVNGILRSWQE